MVKKKRINSTGAAGLRTSAGRGIKLDQVALRLLIALPKFPTSPVRLDTDPLTCLEVTVGEPLVLIHALRQEEQLCGDEAPTRPSASPKTPVQRG